MNVGLINLGNTCFINSTIHILKNLKKFNDILNNIKPYNTDNINFILYTEWIELYNLINSAKFGIISPNKFIKTIRDIAVFKKNNAFSHLSNNDLCEFFMFFIDCIHYVYTKNVIIDISGNKQNEQDELALISYNMLKNVYEKEYSEIMELFYGIHVYQLYSFDGNIRYNIKTEHFFPLNLPIPNIDNINIFDCFDEFLKDEFLIDDNAWFNDKTNLKENIQIKHSFFSLPDILIIFFKRYTNDGYTINSCNIDFDLDKPLNLSKYISGYNSNKYIYNLIAICNYHGNNVNNGHYTTTVKDDNNNWILYNDENVININDIKQIKHNLIYCLVYSL